MLKLKEFRINAGLTQKQVGEIINKSATGYGYYENGINEPDIKTLIKLSEFYHTTIDELLGISHPDLINKNTLLPEERSIVENIKKLNKDNLMKVETYLMSKLEDQNK